MYLTVLGTITTTPTSWKAFAYISACAATTALRNWESVIIIEEEEAAAAACLSPWKKRNTDAAAAATAIILTRGRLLLPNTPDKSLQHYP